ncbi:MAG: RNA methyltransferase [Reichenbachiella sp.]
MLSNRASKFIKSLQLKKFRQSEGQFVVEGAKNVTELINSELSITDLFVTKEFADAHVDFLKNVEFDIVKETNLTKIGSLKTNNAALAVVRIPEKESLNLNEGCTLALDRIKDPGNLGTIIRIADWYGIQQIICSPDSVDCYNPKVISATMGSFTRVQVHYHKLEPLAEQAHMTYATSLDGESILKMQAIEPSIVFFGNESTGLDKQIQSLARKKIKIPGYGHAESLNVAVSVGVFCDNFMRILNKNKN